MDKAQLQVYNDIKRHKTYTSSICSGTIGPLTSWTANYNIQQAQRNFFIKSIQVSMLFQNEIAAPKQNYSIETVHDCAWYLEVNPSTSSSQAYQDLAGGLPWYSNGQSVRLFSDRKYEFENFYCGSLCGFEFNFDNNNLTNDYNVWFTQITEIVFL